MVNGMIKTTAFVEGMSCAMCEAHINEAVRKSFSVRKVTSSRRKGVTEILSDAPLDVEALRKAIDGTGYALREVKSEPYEKKGFSLFH